MKKLAVEEQPPRIVWQEEERTLTLTGEPVLALSLSWPKVEGGGRALAGISRYYARLAAQWKKRWERESYLCACASLAQQRERSRPFTPWRAELFGRTALESEAYWSFAMTAREVRGDGRTLEYRWGDTWRRQDGAPVRLKELYAGEKGWRGRLHRELEQAAEENRRGGICLDQELKRPLRRWFSQNRCALTPEGMEVYYPQCTLAPAVEGAPMFRLPLPPTVTDLEQKEA